MLVGSEDDVQNTFPFSVRGWSSLSPGVLMFAEIWSFLVSFEAPKYVSVSWILVVLWLVLYLTELFKFWKQRMLIV